MNIAVVDDDTNAVANLMEYFRQYGAETGTEFHVVRFEDAEHFLASYRSLEYEVVFMDIDLPGISGIEAAHQLRFKDTSVVLLFITRIAQYAQKGYEVDALDYIVKPLRYPDFCLKMRKAINVSRSREAHSILVKTTSGAICLSTDKVMFVEVMGHQLHFHFVDRVVEARGSLTELEERLKGNGFLRCNNCYLVNTRFINWVHEYQVNVSGNILTISRPRHHQFMKDLMNIYTGGGNDPV